MTVTDRLETPLELDVPNRSKPAVETWTLFQKIAVQFATIYFTLRFALSAASPLKGVLDPVFLRLDSWAAKGIWHITDKVVNAETGSGDRLFDYLTTFWTLIIALLGAALWSLLDRRRPNQRFTYEFLRVELRYCLAFILMSYGFGKIDQFPEVVNAKLMAGFGSEPPMGILWNFMGTSRPYSIFSGVCEVAGAVLLLFRRTTTLGAMVMASVMLNVFALNLFYDVPVKLDSFHYLVAATILIVPDLTRLANVLLFNRPTEPRQLVPPIRYPKLRIGGLVVKWLFFTFQIVLGVWGVVSTYKSTPPKSVLNGIWQVASFKQNGAELKTVDISDPVRWQTIAVDSYGSHTMMTIQLVGGSKPLFWVVDTKNALFRGGDPTFGLQSLSYRLDEENTIHIEGQLRGVPTAIELRRATAQYPLTKRRIHWIQEYPRTP